MVSSLSGDVAKQRKERTRAADLQIAKLDSRLSRLTDAYLDGVIERDEYNAKRLSLLVERSALAERADTELTPDWDGSNCLPKFLELIESLPLSYETATVAERREILKTVTSNFSADGKNVVVELRSPFREIAQLNAVQDSGLHRGRPRTRAQRIFCSLVKHFAKQARMNGGQESKLSLVA
jgi:hypothetical protein